MMSARRILASLLLLAPALGACGDNGGSGGVDPEPAFALEMTRLDFGDVRVGGTRSTDLTIENTGTIELDLEVVRETASMSPVNVRLSPPRLLPGETGNVSVSFAPTESGAVEARFLIQIVGGGASSPNATLAVTGRGTEPMGVASPTRLDFGALIAGTTATLAFSLENTGLEAIDVEVLPTTNVDRCAFMAQNPAPFCVDVPENALVPLAAGERRDVEVTFRPGMDDMDASGGLTVRFCRSSSPSCVQEIALSGTTTSDDLACAPAEFDFGALNPGVCASLSLACENVGNVPVTMVQTAFTPNTASEFALRGSVPATVGPGERGEITIDYCPQAEGAHTGGLVVTSVREGRGVRQDTFPLSGQGGGPDIIADRSIDFGTVSTLAPARRVLRVQNRGADDLEIQQVDLSTTMGATWAVRTDLPVTVPPSGLVELEIEVQPIDEGPHAATAALLTNDRDTPRWSVSLDVRGALLPPCGYTLDFPADGPITLSTRVGAAVTRSFALRNTGSSPCQVTTIELREPSAESLSLSGTNLRSHSVEAGSSSTIRLRFVPSEAGMVTGRLFVGVSSPTEPFTTIAVEASATE